MTKEKPKRAAGYLRVSQARDGMHADKIYRSEIESYAGAFSYRLLRIFEDIDFSGRKGSKQRPRFTEMLERAEAGEFDLLIVPKLSRFGRSMRDNLDAYDRLEAANVGIAFLDLRVDTSTSGGKLMRNVLTALAEYESDLISERWKDTHRYLARNGRHLGGVTVPFGYRYNKGQKVLLIEKGEARIVRQLFERYVNAWSLKQLAYDLNARGVVGRKGKREWLSGHVARMLDNPTYAGWRHYQGELTEGTWEPLVDRELFEQAQKIRTATGAPRPAENRKGKGKALLTGLFHCSCGAAMWRDFYAQGNGAARSRYLCANSARRKRGACRAGEISGERAEQFVTEAFLERLSLPHAKRTREAGIKVEAEENDLGERIKSAQGRMGRLIDLMASSPGPGADRAYGAKLEALEGDLAVLEAERSRSDAAGALARRDAEQMAQLRERAGNLREIWKVANTEEQRDMLATAIKSVALLPGGRPKTVQIEWQSGV